MFDATLNNTNPAKGSRFESLLRGSGKLSTNAPWNTILYSDGDFVIAPTLGSLVPLWLLLVPTRPFLNFVQVSKEYGRNPIGLLTKILSQRFDYHRNFVWFEHGAATTGSVTGCGVDQAHLHIILDPTFTFESFRLAVMSMANYSWECVAPEASYDNRNWRQEYLVFGNKEVAVRTNLANPPISQFFRRAISGVVGRDSEWDYRNFPNGEIAKETVCFIADRLKNRVKQ